MEMPVGSKHSLLISGCARQRRAADEMYK